MALDELTREFLIESQEGLDRMERCLTELEERPTDAGLIGDIFRSVHTIKGTTGFLGFTRLEKLAHSGENLLGLLREGKLTADRPTITGLLKLMDGLRAILKAIEVESSEGDGNDVELIALMGELQAPAKAQTKQPVRLRAGAHPAPADAGEPQLAQPLTAALEHSSLATAAAHPAAPSPDEPALEVPSATAAQAPQQVEAAQETFAAPAAKASVETESNDAKLRAPAMLAGTAAESTLRVDITLLNRMMNLVGELVLTRNQVLQATAADPSMTAWIW
jgi:two-component system chemotaxis sensor kinase CheA